MAGRRPRPGFCPEAVGFWIVFVRANTGFGNDRVKVVTGFGNDETGAVSEILRARGRTDHGGL